MCMQVDDFRTLAGNLNFATSGRVGPAGKPGENCRGTDAGEEIAPCTHRTFMRWLYRGHKCTRRRKPVRQSTH